MLWAAVCLCFFGFLRAGKITVPSDSSYDAGAHVNADDIAVDSKSHPQVMRVRIKASKTDPFWQGVDVFLGRTGSPLCPIAAVLAYGSARFGQRPLVAIHRWPFSDTGQIRFRSTRSSDSWGYRLLALCWPQLPDRSSHYGCSARSQWCNYQDVREMAEFCIPTLHQNSQQPTSWCLAGPGQEYVISPVSAIPLVPCCCSVLLLVLE